MLKRLLVLGIGAAALAACEQTPAAPTDRGVCYSVTVRQDNTVKFNRLADNQPSLEECIARLEEMRVRFLRMGGSRRAVTGAFQGKYIFVDPAGVATSDSLTGGRYFAFSRAPDGTLALPNIVNRDLPATAPEGSEQK